MYLYLYVYKFVNIRVCVCVYIHMNTLTTNIPASLIMMCLTNKIEKKKIKNKTLCSVYDHLGGPYLALLRFSILPRP